MEGFSPVSLEQLFNILTRISLTVMYLTTMRKELATYFTLSEPCVVYGMLCLCPISFC